MAPTTASSVFPAAMIAAPQIGMPVVTLTTNAASETAGQSRVPRRTSAARAIPVGGHTVVAMPASASNDSPNRAVATYATKTTA